MLIASIALWMLALAPPEGSTGFRPGLNWIPTETLVSFDRRPITVCELQNDIAVVGAGESGKDNKPSHAIVAWVSREGIVTREVKIFPTGPDGTPGKLLGEQVLATSDGQARLLVAGACVHPTVQAQLVWSAVIEDGEINYARTSESVLGIASADAVAILGDERYLVAGCVTHDEGRASQVWYTIFDSKGKVVVERAIDVGQTVTDVRTIAAAVPSGDGGAILTVWLGDMSGGMATLCRESIIFQIDVLGQSQELARVPGRVVAVHTSGKGRVSLIIDQPEETALTDNDAKVPNELKYHRASGLHTDARYGEIDREHKLVLVRKIFSRPTQLPTPWWNYAFNDQDPGNLRTTGVTIRADEHQGKIAMSLDIEESSSHDRHSYNFPFAEPIMGVSRVTACREGYLLTCSEAGLPRARPRVAILVLKGADATVDKPK